MGYFVMKYTIRLVDKFHFLNNVACKSDVHWKMDTSLIFSAASNNNNEVKSDVSHLTILHLSVITK